MKTIKQYLGKVSITCNGRWDINTEYDRLCFVYNNVFDSYISKKPVPVGIELEDEMYWQPVAHLRADIADDYVRLLSEITNITTILKKSRIAVENDEERHNLKFGNVLPGCEVYVRNTKRTYVVESINPVNNVKTWNLESEGKIDSDEKYELFGICDDLVAQRAICDKLGRIIDEEYLTRNAVKEYVVNTIIQYLQEFDIVFPNESITEEMLSKSLLDLISSGGNVVNNVDEEDLTIKILSNKGEVIKFKDKEYKQGQFTGLGRVYLRRNMVGQINLLEQHMINKPNTIYIVQYDYCLDNKTITIPANSTLLFTGGSFNRGTIILDNTKINGIINLSEVFKDVTISGTYREGQTMYDIDRKKVILFNGDSWVNLDGSSLNN